MFPDIPADHGETGDYSESERLSPEKQKKTTKERTCSRSLEALKMFFESGKGSSRELNSPFSEHRNISFGVLVWGFYLTQNLFFFFIAT